MKIGILYFNSLLDLQYLEWWHMLNKYNYFLFFFLQYQGLNLVLANN
jgi:hypothetical protein